MGRTANSTYDDGLMLVEVLIRNAFDRPRTPRSVAYKRGAQWALDFRILDLRAPFPYQPGTAEADAFFAGRDEGNEIWRAHQAANPDATSGD